MEPALSSEIPKLRHSSNTVEFMEPVQRSKAILSFEIPKFKRNAVTEFEWEVRSLKENMSASSLPLNRGKIESESFRLQGIENRQTCLRLDGNAIDRYALQLRGMEHFCLVVETWLTCGTHRVTTRHRIECNWNFSNLMTIMRDTELGRAIVELNTISVLVRITTVSAIGQSLSSTPEWNVLVVPAMPTLASNLESALTSADFTDVTLKSEGGESFPAHRQLLAMRSPVFKAMFYGQMREAGTGVASINASSGSVKHLLKFIYSDEVEEDGVETFGSELFELGVQYELPRLTWLIKDQLFRTLSVDNVCERLTLAVRFSMGELEKSCKSIIKTHLAAVMDTKGWLHVARDATVMRMLMSCDSSQDDHRDLSPRKLKRARLEPSQIA